MKNQLNFRLTKSKEYTLLVFQWTSKQALIANFTYELVKAFNSYYQTTKISKIENNEVKLFRLSLSYKVGLIIKSSMLLLGIKVPDKM